MPHHTTEIEEDNRVRMGDREFKKVKEFKYLGSTIDRVSAGWNGWRKVVGVLCDRNVPASVQGPVYCTCLRPVMLYGSGNDKSSGVKDGSGRSENARMLIGIDLGK